MSNIYDLQKYLSQRHAADIETKGFYDVVHTPDDVWCLCSVTEDDTVLLFHDYPEFDNQVVTDPTDGHDYTIPPRAGTLLEGVKYWYMIAKNGGELAIHNLRTFDKPVIKKLWPKFEVIDSCWKDTYIQSKVQWFDRPCPKGAKSAHGLDAYGRKFGVAKPPINDWTTMDAYKLHRCIEDCRIQKKVATFLDEEAHTFKKRFGMNFEEGLALENRYAEICHQQEVNGALLDEELVHEHVAYLDKSTKELADYIEPLLPKTLKIKKATRVGRKDLVKLLYNKDIEDEFDEEGEVVKRYYAPYTNYLSKPKTTSYSGFHLSYGQSPSFEKLTEMRAWVKETHPDTEFKEWEYEKEEVVKVVLDGNTCKHFDLNPEDTDIIVGPHTRFTFIDSKLTQHEVYKGYLIKQGIKWAMEWNLKKDENGRMVKAKEPMEVRYPPKANPQDQLVMKIAKGEAIVTSPKFGEKEYEQLGDDAQLGKDIARYNTEMHRRRYLSNFKDPENKGVLSYLREDGRIPCGCSNFMTSSGRSVQRVIVNLPNANAHFGKQMRSIIKAPEGKKLVGADQKSSQLSIAAFISDNKNYYNAVASGEKEIELEDGRKKYLGESAHCVNARMFGLVSEEEWKEAVKTNDTELIKKLNRQRDKYAKGGAFACLPVDRTEVLTKDGWRHYEDLYEGLEVMTYNRDKGVNELQPIQKLHHFEDKEVVRMGNSSWSIDSTKDHRWLGKRSTGTGKTRYEVEEFIETQNIKSEFKLYNSAPTVGQKLQLNLTVDEVRILGLIFSDGYLTFSKKSDTISSSHGKKKGLQCEITQADHTYGQYVEDLLTRNNCLQNKIYKKGAENPCANYRIKREFMRDLWIRAGFGQKDKHEVDLSYFMMKLDKESVEAFIDAFWLADVHTSSGAKFITQNRGKILDGVCTALTLLGINFSIQKKNGIYEPSGKECVSIRFKKKTHTGSTKFTKEVLGVEPTFCLTTENSTFICKQGDITTITGNCIFGAAGKKLGLMMGRPEEEGDNLKNNFLTQMGLTKVIDYVKRCKDQFPHQGGFFIPVMGYWLWCNSEHKGVNYFCQGLEAIVQKMAVVKTVDTFEERGWKLDDVKLILQVHDEGLYETKESLAPEVAKITRESYTYAGVKLLEWYQKNQWAYPAGTYPTICPDFDGGADIGDTYYDCH